MKETKRKKNFKSDLIQFFFFFFQKGSSSQYLDRRIEKTRTCFFFQKNKTKHKKRRSSFFFFLSSRRGVQRIKKELCETKECFVSPFPEWQSPNSIVVSVSLFCSSPQLPIVKKFKCQQCSMRATSFSQPLNQSKTNQGESRSSHWIIDVQRPTSTISLSTPQNRKR